MTHATVESIHEYANASNETWLAPGANSGAVVTTAQPISEAGPGTLTYIKNASGAKYLPEVRATVLVVPSELEIDRAQLAEQGVALVVFSANPRLDFIRLIDRFFAPTRPSGISASAVVSPDAQVAGSAYVGPGATLAAGVVVGEGSVIHAGVHVYHGVTIGRNVTVHAGTAIGSDGFGYERDENGNPIKFPHIGAVVIEDDVELGANTVVDRGTLGDTRICARAKIDNLCHIAHNVVIGSDTMIAAGAMVAGSTKVGERVWIGPQAAISDGLVVGDDAFVTLGAVVTRNVEDGGRVTGNFAVDHKRFISHMRTMR